MERDVLLEQIKVVESYETVLANAKIVKEKLENIRSKCNHELVVLAAFWGCNDIEAKCLICGKEIRDKRELDKDSKILDMTYGNISVLKDEIYKMVLNIFIDEILKAPADISIEQIYNEIKKKLRAN